jgi:MoaA/NifB/PqqE/SkfB family radical SAM enzyme
MQRSESPEGPLGIDLLNHGLMSLLGTAARLCLSDPSQASFVAHAISAQRRAASTRARLEAQGVHVPPLLIVSVTSECNLHCKGCYARAQHRDECCSCDSAAASAAGSPAGQHGDMDDTTLRSVLDEASELGVSAVLLAGGEPLVRQGLLDITADYPDILFPLFTNGLLVTDDLAARLRKQRNVIPVLSIEGGQDVTDGRRGIGVWDRIHSAAAALRRGRVFFGASFTVRSDTLDVLTDERFIDEMIAMGCRLFFFVEYVPVQPGTEAWELTADQRAVLAQRVEALKASAPALFVAFPGDEEATGGCLAAGRGFVHISAGGDVEPCPFAPYSDTSVRRVRLRDALNSPLLQAIRDDHNTFADTSGGCALWRRRSEVQEVLQAVRAGRS